MSIQAAQMQAMQAMRAYPGAYPGAMYPGYPSPYPQGGPAGMQGAAAAGMPGPGVPGGGAPDGGLSAAYAAWANAYGGGAGYGGHMGGAAYGGGAKGSGCGGMGGDGFQKGRGKGKGKGKGWKGSFGGCGGPMGGDGLSAAGVAIASDPRRQIELAQRRAKQRDRSAISQAQRSAQQRFERDLLDRVQGHWLDESDSSTRYVVEGSLCSVSGGENSRVFRNRLCVYGGELCWDARRFWHNLNLNALPPVGEQVERVEWTLGEGSPPSRNIVWLRTTPLEPIPGSPKGEDAEGEGGEGHEDAAEDGEGEGDAAESPAPGEAEALAAEAEPTEAA